ncbi:MAG: protein translocase SEC61 complex subunit gamma [Candidatus Nanoarchaeia archaeon]|jgi:protein transport protein SEC61 subunit gamma-like protein
MSIINKIKRALREYKRVLGISRKPNKEEFTAILKICGMGIMLIGIIGFVIQFIYQYLIKAVM